MRKTDGLLEHREHGVLLHARKQPAHHRRNLVAGEGDGIRLGQRFVREPLGEPAHLASEGATKVFVGAVRALHEAVSGPGRVVRVGLAGAEVALDLVGDAGLAVVHAPTSASSQLRMSRRRRPASERRGPQNIGPIASCAFCTARQRSSSLGAKAACVDEGRAAICFWARSRRRARARSGSGRAAAEQSWPSRYAQHPRSGVRRWRVQRPRAGDDASVRRASRAV